MACRSIATKHSVDDKISFFLAVSVTCGIFFREGIGEEIAMRAKANNEMRCQPIALKDTRQSSNKVDQKTEETTGIERSTLVRFYI